MSAETDPKNHISRRKALGFIATGVGVYTVGLADFIATNSHLTFLGDQLTQADPTEKTQLQALMLRKEFRSVADIGIFLIGTLAMIKGLFNWSNFINLDTQQPPISTLDENLPS